MLGPARPGRPPAPGRWHAEHEQRRFEAWSSWHGGAPPQPWRLPPWLTLWAPVILSLLIQVPATVVATHMSGADPATTALIVGISLIGPLALIGARRFPGPVVAVTAAAAILDLILSSVGGPPYLALAFAIISAIVRGARVWAWVSVSLCWLATLGVAIFADTSRFAGARVAGTTLGFLIAVGIGETIRGRRERSREFQRMATERRVTAVQAERVRIARELHDVLAHSLSQINVQAGVGLHLMDKQPEKAAEALAHIKETSKTALDEVRSVLGILRAENGADPAAPLVPEPGIDRIAALTLAGIRVDVDNRLEGADVPQPVQLAIYRIVQESLTNVARHAAGATVVHVSLHRDADGYR
ncbi:MAG TPA: histidine kinase, partial [Pseudolysinimonas sp.]|nr:histidine kinase [Pseudolysinimonas sp.]